jgi:hypothetical protein
VEWDVVELCECRETAEGGVCERCGAATPIEDERKRLGTAPTHDNANGGTEHYATGR